MKTKIVFFSGTGNSYKAARDLSELLGDSVIVHISNALAEAGGESADRLGLMFPVHGGGVPDIVRNFINRLTPGSAGYYFTIACSGTQPGIVTDHARRLFGERGLELSLAAVVRMPGNFTPVAEACPPEVQREMFTAEEQKIGKIARIILNGGRLIEESTEEGRNYVEMMKGRAAKMMPFHTAFRVDENCRCCGTCAAICPVGNISRPEGKPVWSDGCTRCFGCLQWCPGEAIQYGDATRGKKRYRNPEVRLQELLRG